MGRSVVEPIGLKPQMLAVETPMFAPSCEFSSLSSKVTVLSTPSKIVLVMLDSNSKLLRAHARHVRVVNLRQTRASFGPHLPTVTRTFGLISGLGLTAQWGTSTTKREVSPAQTQADSKERKPTRLAKYKVL